MSELSCVQVRELAAEHAMGLLTGAERADVVGHVAGCPACQAEVYALCETADLIPMLAPELEPPVGFGARAFDAMVGGRIPRWWRPVAAAAAVAAAASILSIAIVRIVESNGDSSDESRAAVPGSSRVRSAAMVGSSGYQVGNVHVVPGAPPLIVMNVDYALADGSYTIRVRSSTNRSVPLAKLDVNDGRASWAGTVPDGVEPVVVELIDASGEVVCSAQVPRTSSA